MTRLVSGVALVFVPLPIIGAEAGTVPGGVDGSAVAGVVSIDVGTAVVGVVGVVTTSGEVGGGVCGTLNVGAVTVTIVDATASVVVPEERWSGVGSVLGGVVGVAPAIPTAPVTCIAGTVATPRELARALVSGTTPAPPTTMPVAASTTNRQRSAFRGVNEGLMISPVS
jgi:hypothetical protein